MLVWEKKMILKKECEKFQREKDNLLLFMYLGGGIKRNPLSKIYTNIPCFSTGIRTANLWIQSQP